MNISVSRANIHFVPSLYKLQSSSFHVSVINSKGQRNYINRKTGRGCGNAVMPRFEWRYSKAQGRFFQKQYGIKFGFDMGLEDKLLLVSLADKKRRLDEKKIKQLGRIMEERIYEVMSSNELLSTLAMHIAEVRVDRSFSKVIVKWTCQGEGDEDIRKVLDESRYDIRRKISELIGTTCPEVVFSEDRTKLMEAEMDRIFREADYGTDYRTLSRTSRILGKVDVVEEKKENEKVPVWLQLIRERKTNKNNDNLG